MSIQTKFRLHLDRGRQVLAVVFEEVSTLIHQNGPTVGRMVRTNPIQRRTPIVIP